MRESIIAAVTTILVMAAISYGAAYIKTHVIHFGICDDGRCS